MKKLLIAVAAMAAMAMPARADEAELLARIEALEQRVAQLEATIAGGEASQEAITEDGNADETITLGTGTWIVGQDVPPGKYKITCISGLGMLHFYTSYEERKENEYNSYEDHLMCGTNVFDEMANSPYDTDTIMSMYTSEINNVLLEDGYCIYSELQEILLTPLAIG